MAPSISTNDGATNSFQLLAEYSPHGKTSFAKHLKFKLTAKRPEAEYVDVSPEMATEMLRYNVSESAHNRPRSDATTTKYAQLMKAGYWGINGNGTSEPIIFSDAGRLLSGQHRLRAVEIANITQRFLIVFGEPDGNFAFIDQGRRRTSSDIFSMNDVPNYSVISAAASWVWSYEFARFNNTLRPSPQELYDFYLEHEAIQESVPIGRLFSDSRLAPPAMMTALHYLCARKSQALAGTFFEQVATGIGILAKTTPANKLRQRLLQNHASASAKLSALLIAAFTVKAWNAARAGRQVGVLKWRTEQSPNESFPKVV